MRPTPACLLALFLAVIPLLSAAPRVPDDYRVGGFVIGPQLFSFKFFTLFEAIEKSAATGGRAIELARNAHRGAGR